MNDPPNLLKQRKRTIDAKYQNGLCYQPTNNGQADHPEILALITYGQQLFTTQNTSAWTGHDYGNALYIKLTVDPDYTKVAYCDFQLPLMLKAMMNPTAGYTAHVICSESAACLSVLPRICGYDRTIGMTGAKAWQRGSNHAYNIYDSRQYDAYPFDRSLYNDTLRRYINTFFKKGIPYHLDTNLYQKDITIPKIQIKP